MLPIALALLAESTPSGRRALFLSIALVCFSGGNLASGAMAAWWLPEYRLEKASSSPAASCRMAALLLLVFVPGILSFRVNRNPADPRVAASDRPARSDGGGVGGDRVPPGRPGRVSRFGPLAMFGRRYLIQTVLIFAACFFALGNIALLANWLSTFMFELRGVPLETFAFYMIIGYFGGASARWRWAG